MARFSRNKIIIISSLVILLIAAGGWLYTQRVKRIVIASYVPESALGYLEINDWPNLIDRFTETEAWQQLAPGYGVGNRLDYLGKVGWLARWSGENEMGILSRSQFAVVITGLEVRGDQIRPRMALIAETHSSPDALRRLAETRLPQFVRRIYGRELKQSSQYSGVTITSYHSENPERQLLSAQIEGELIIANHPDPLRACIDTRLGRAPSMANNFHWQNSRPLIEGNGEIFGFMTGQGMARLMRFAAFMLSGNVLRGSGLAETLEEVLSDFASRASDGIAYGASFENGHVIDRYALLFKPDLVESLKPAIIVNQGASRAISYIPSSSEEVTLINVADPDKTLDKIEAAISARIGVGESFLLHQFLLGARRSFLSNGIESALGNEIASFSIPGKSTDRIWLVSVRDRGILSKTIEPFLSQLPGSGSSIRRETRSGIELLSSNDARKSAAAIVGDFLAVGTRSQLIRFIDSQPAGRPIKDSPQYISAAKWSQPAAVTSYSSVKEEAGLMMTSLVQWVGVDRKGPIPALEQLPFAISSTLNVWKLKEKT
ncbi:MAG: hypothetical protein L0220_15290, partial [Acidobacteria bacterium]|nr:hypothetical protein [Acidobacteriota bacterium]